MQNTRFVIPSVVAESRKNRESKAKESRIFTINMRLLSQPGV